MNDSEGKWRVALLVLMALILATLVMNTCAMDRLEKQFIRQARDVERVLAGAGGSSPVRAASRETTGPAGQAIPGTGTGVEVAGWGGRRAEVLHVEGAVADAPLRLADKPKPQGDTYVNRRSSPPGTLNYYTSNEGEIDTIWQYAMGRLMRLDLDHPPAVLPDLAMSWEVSPDKLTYTYRLRRGAQFADGRPFTSADVKFSFDVVRDPTVKAEHLRSEFDDVEDLSAPDPHTVVVKYRKKYWKGIYGVGYSLRILNKGWYEEQIPLWAKRLDVATFSTEPGKPGFGDVFNKMSVPCPSTAPYYYAAETYDPTKPVEIVQNPFFWGIQAMPTWYNFAKMRWIFISDEVAAFEEFRKQHSDLTTVDFNAYDDDYSKDPSLTSIADYYEYDHVRLSFQFISWNCRKPPFDDARVRKAMTLLTNREWILKEVERGRGRIATCYTKASYPTYSPDIVPLPFDVEAARKLLAEAGWKDGDGDGVLDRDGKRFEFEFKVGSTRRFFTQVGAVLEDACKKVGIRMSYRNLEWATFIEDYYNDRFDAACLLASWPDPWIDPYDEYHSSQDVPRGGNRYGWHDARVDALVEAMREEFDEDKRTAMYHEFNHLVAEGQPQTLLIEPLVGVLINKRFSNVHVRPTGMRPDDFWTEPEKVLYK